MVLKGERSGEIDGGLFGGDCRREDDETLRQYRLKPDVKAEPVFPVELINDPRLLLPHIPRCPILPAEDGVGFTIPLGYLHDQMQDKQEVGVLVFETGIGAYELVLLPMDGRELPQSFADGYRQGPIRGFVYDRNKKDLEKRLKIISLGDEKINISDIDLETMVGFAESFVIKAYDRNQRYRISPQLNL